MRVCVCVCLCVCVCVVRIESLMHYHATIVVYLASYPNQTQPSHTLLL